MPLRNAWIDAANDYFELVMDLEPRRANKRRIIVFTNEYSTQALAQADALVARAQTLEKKYYTCMDLCDYASAAEEDCGDASGASSVHENGGDDAASGGPGSSEGKQNGSAPDAESSAHHGWVHEEENGVSAERVQCAEDAVELLLAAAAAGAASGTKRCAEEEEADEQTHKRARESLDESAETGNANVGGADGELEDCD
jgi:hypothetical protein